jgi:hypothetical protein
LELFHKNEFEISAPQCPIRYSPAGNGDILDIVVHQNIGLSSVTVSNILDSDYLPIIFHILDHVKIRNLSEPIEKFTDWERFRSLASDLMSPRLEISTGVEAAKAAREFTASIASAYRLSTSKVKISEVNTNLPGLDRLLKQKQRVRKLWQETRDPARKIAVNWVTNAIRRMTRRLERWETKLANTELTLPAIWPIAKSLTNRDGLRAPTAIHGLLGLKYHLADKANATADCLENQFIPQDLCDENHERRVEARVQALLEAADNNPPEKI